MAMDDTMIDRHPPFHHDPRIAAAVADGRAGTRTMPTVVIDALGAVLKACDGCRYAGEVRRMLEEAGP